MAKQLPWLLRWKWLWPPHAGAVWSSLLNEYLAYEVCLLLDRLLAALMPGEERDVWNCPAVQSIAVHCTAYRARKSSRATPCQLLITVGWMQAVAAAIIIFLSNSSACSDEITRALQRIAHSATLRAVEGCSSYWADIACAHNCRDNVSWGVLLQSTCSRSHCVNRGTTCEQGLGWC